MKKLKISYLIVVRRTEMIVVEHWLEADNEIWRIA